MMPGQVKKDEVVKPLPEVQVTETPTLVVDDKVLISEIKVQLDPLPEKIAEEASRMEQLSEEDIEEWANEYELLRKNPPHDGDYLRTEDGSKVEIEINLPSGQSPFMFARAYLPSEVGCTLNWYVKGENAKGFMGLKCILLPKSKEQIFQKGALATKADDHGRRYFFVKELVVRRASRSGQALLCEVSEW